MSSPMMNIWTFPVNHELEKIDKRKNNSLKSQIHFFEKRISSGDKGTYTVWKTVDKPTSKVQIPVYLHAVNDSKPVYRISTKDAAKPPVKLMETELNASTGRKVAVEKITSEAHSTFRKKMGFNNGSHRMRRVLG